MQKYSLDDLCLLKRKSARVVTYALSKQVVTRISVFYLQHVIVECADGLAYLYEI